VGRGSTGSTERPVANGGQPGGGDPASLEAEGVAADGSLGPKEVERKVVQRLLALVLGVGLGIGVLPAARAQSLALPADGRARTLGEALRSRQPAWRLTLGQLERVGSPTTRPRPASEDWGSDQPRLALADITTSFLSRFDRPGHHANGFVHTARFAARLMNAPNRFLSHLTGADRANLDLGHRRLTFTWFTSW
jgi:hypothetical protein